MLGSMTGIGHAFRRIDFPFGHSAEFRERHLYGLELDSPQEASTASSPMTPTAPLRALPKQQLYDASLGGAV